MLDFVMPYSDEKKKKLKPKFQYMNSKDLMIKGRDFYAIWDETKGAWSTSEDDALELIDAHVRTMRDSDYEDYYAESMRDTSNRLIGDWHRYCQKDMRDNFHPLDEKLIFANDPVRKEDYASKRLPYALEEGDISSYDSLMSVLYSPEERHKLEWAIGAVVSGDSKTIQKFVVLYGSGGTGKSTVLNIIQKLFDGYYAVFDSKALGSNNASFALEPFKNNPLVGIQHDGDLSKIEDNTRINSLVSHEEMSMNEKFKALYTMRFNAFLFMGTNKPVKITDSRSGIIRRLIDVHPTGNKIPSGKYNLLVNGIDFELGAIAYHCLSVYKDDPNAYDGYKPSEMMGATNDFYDFMLEQYNDFVKSNATTLSVAWERYKAYCDDAKVPYPLPKRQFREELRNYFRDFEERHCFSDGTSVRSYYYGFLVDRFEENTEANSTEESTLPLIDLQIQESIFDRECTECPAQYAIETENGEIPGKKWADVSTTLADIDTRKVHYVKVPVNHIVIDFDIKDEDGNKSPEKNLEAASKWPATYAELSKGGAGIHLHYIYTGDPEKLAILYDTDIEIKVFTGGSSLRRRLSKCNNLPIATISSGLPLKGETKMVRFDKLANEKALITVIKQNLNKEHGSTRQSIDFIASALDNAYNSGMSYDVTILKDDVFALAEQSTHQATYCIKKVMGMKFRSDDRENAEFDDMDFIDKVDPEDLSNLVMFDTEVFPNVVFLNWKYHGKGKTMQHMINPTPAELEPFFKNKLVGVNNLSYDNYILWAIYMGYTNAEVYELSHKIISKAPNAIPSTLREAAHISFTDIMDFASNKQSLKKWEIELGIHHEELFLDWDQPVPEEMWPVVSQYCDNDVLATEAVWDHLQPEFTARKILADISGLTVNHRTNAHTTKIIFGNERHPKLEYTNLEETFPGYFYGSWKQYYDIHPEYIPEDTKLHENRIKDPTYHNLFRGDEMGRGGYVYAEPGMYVDVALLDVASLHPHSIKAMNCFGEYTKNFTDLMDVRIFVKHKDYESAKALFGGRLAKYLNDPSTAKQLAQALKIAINSVYGLTSAKFDNPFKDPRNVNNIVACRGALFMRTLQDEVKARGFTVAHIKTDSIKIPDATQEIVDFCMDFAEQYGYEFEHEATYEKMCLVNNAVYIAKYAMGDHPGEWTATGAQFAVPYVFKTLFSHEDITFDDLCETKNVKSKMYLNRNEENPEANILDFVGKNGQFTPVLPGQNGGLLVKEVPDNKNGGTKYDSVTGCKEYRWLESEGLRKLGVEKAESMVDIRYFDGLVEDARKAIWKYGNFDWFVENETQEPMDVPPWISACGRDTCEGCYHLCHKDGGFGCAKQFDNSDVAALNPIEETNEQETDDELPF